MKAEQKVLEEEGCVEEKWLNQFGYCGKKKELSCLEWTVVLKTSRLDTAEEWIESPESLKFAVDQIQWCLVRDILSSYICCHFFFMNLFFISKQNYLHNNSCCCSLNCANTFLDFVIILSYVWSFNKQLFIFNISQIIKLKPRGLLS